jgi:uncharacterized protein
MKFSRDAAGARLPIKLDSASNGEYVPIPLAPVHHEARQCALDAVERNAKRLGLGRRRFLVSACGAATTLLAMNAAYARNGFTGGFFDVPGDAALDLHAARSPVDGAEFIFDVQGHFVNPTDAWTRRLPPAAKPLQMPKTAECGPGRGPGRLDYLQCIGPEEFVKDVFMDSDTDLMVLSFVPSSREAEPLTIEEAEATARIVERLQGGRNTAPSGRIPASSPMVRRRGASS